MSAAAPLHDVLVTCAKGVPPVLARELRALGFPLISVGEAAVETRADRAGLYRLNLQLRSAHRVLLRLASWPVRTPDDLYRAAYRLPWEDWIAPDATFSVHGAVENDTIRDTRYANLKLKDAVVDRIRAQTGSRPDSGPQKDGVMVFLYWKNEEASVYLDLSGIPLSRRGYRTQGGAAPVQEALAAALLLSTAWDGTTPLVNPMCGSGTFAIEAAWIATRTAPGLLRSHFSLMALRDFEPELWRSECERARAEKVPATAPIVASDHDPAVLAFARANAARAGVEDLLELSLCDFTATPLPPPPGALVLNPEYGVRLGAESDLKPHYRAIGDWLKQRCSGYTAHVLCGNIALSKQIGLRPSQKLTFYNGRLECRWLEFPLYA